MSLLVNYIIHSKVLAKTLGMKWGAYHLARPGNPIKQAEHFLEFTKPEKDELLALDIEHNDPKRWMSLADGEIFARHIKMRTGRYPVLYTNHSTSKFIATHRAKYPLLSRLNLWYARYKADTRGVFPMGHWKSYTLWQFSSMVNCNDKTCPWRINGAGNWIDVNVVAMSPAKLKKAWPFAKLRAGGQASSDDLIASNDNIDTMTTGSVSAVASTKRASLQLDVSKGSLPVMAIANARVSPTWRPGSVIVKRVAWRTSDEVLDQLYSERILPVVNRPTIKQMQSTVANPVASVVYRASSIRTLNLPGEI